MQDSSKQALLAIAKDRVDQRARELIVELSRPTYTGQGSLGQQHQESHFEKWRQGMTWRTGYGDSPNIMLEAVEAYAKSLNQKVKEVRDLQVAYDELKAQEAT